MKREKISPETVFESARRTAGHPISKARSKEYAIFLEGFAQKIIEWKSLDLESVEPATIFVPFESD